MINSNSIAVTHDWLLDYAGAERVLEQILNITGPDTTVFTTVFEEVNFPFLANHEVVESFISRLPFGRSKYRNYLPLMPLAVEQWDMNPYDIVISSTHAVAKGIICHPDQLHVSYVHSPIRYAWDLQHQYLKEADLNQGIKAWIIKYLLHRIRKWDVRTANQVDHFVANSKFIQRRIKKVYRRDSEVIYPPVDVDSFEVNREKDDYFVTANRLVPYKKTRLLVEAFNGMPDKKLVVIGDGPDYEAIKKIAGDNIEMKGFIAKEDLVNYLRNAKAFVYAAVEDFGISPVEAQACGTPVIALSKGGTKETVVPLGEANPTGVLFDRQEIPHIHKAVEQFEEHNDQFEVDIIRKHAEKFSTAEFQNRFQTFLEKKWDDFKSHL